jgi:hypothetical protein
VAPGELVDRPDGDARLAERADAVGRLVPARRPQSLREAVALGREPVERLAEEALELGRQVGNCGE